LRITSGTAIGQRRRIVGNTATTLTVERNFEVTPGATDTYFIFGDTDRIYMVGNAQGAMLGYQIDKDLWMTGDTFDAGIARPGAVSQNIANVPIQEPVGIVSIVYAAVGIASIVFNTGGSGYVFGDIGTICTIANSTGGKAMITGVAAGAVTSVILIASGSAATSGSQTITGGTGTAATVTVTTGKTGLLTTTISHNYVLGQSVTISGAATDATWNGNFTIIGVDSNTTFSIANASGTASPTFTAASTTTLLDVTRAWTTNEHTGRLVVVYDTTGTAPSNTYITRISSNTATTLTFTAITSGPVQGLARYQIMDICPFGREEIYKIPAQGATGYATAGGATTLTDSTKAWLPNQWTNYKVRVIAGTGLGNESAITSNTATALTVASWGVATPDTTSKYQIMDSFGLVTTGAAGSLTDTTKNWVTNSLIGKRIKITGGLTAGGQGQEVAITANTATTITCAGPTTVTNQTTYSIISPPQKGANCGLHWLFGTTKLQKGKYLISPNGAAGFPISSVMNLYNINTRTWDVPYTYTPQTEALTLGTMYAYDAVDRIYINVANSSRVIYLDLTTNTVQGSSTVPFGHGAALSGNRMEIVKASDLSPYLYIMRAYWK